MPLTPRPALPWLIAAATLLAALALGGCRSDGSFSSEGTQGSPIDIGIAAATYSGTVGPDVGSYYRVTVTAEATHTISMTSLVDDADLHVYGTGGFFGGTAFCTSVKPGTESETCSGTTVVSETILYIYVKPFTSDGTGFLLTVN